MKPDCLNWLNKHSIYISDTVGGGMHFESCKEGEEQVQHAVVVTSNWYRTQYDIMKFILRHWGAVGTHCTAAGDQLQL